MAGPWIPALPAGGAELAAAGPLPARPAGGTLKWNPDTPEPPLTARVPVAGLAAGAPPAGAGLAAVAPPAGLAAGGPAPSVFAGRVVPVPGSGLIADAPPPRAAGASRAPVAGLAAGAPPAAARGRHTALVLRLSAPGAAAGNTAAPAGPDGALGGYVATTGVPGDLFGDLDALTNSLGLAAHRCVFVVNTHPALTAAAVTVWFAAAVPGGANIAIALDGAPASPLGQAAAQAAAVGADWETPAGVGPFTAPAGPADGLAVGDLPPGYARAVWLRRTPIGAGAVPGDGVPLAVRARLVAA